MEFNLESTCRMCIKNIADKNVFTCKIFHKLTRVFCYEIMTSMFSVSVHAGDGLPPNICSKCFEDISSAYKLKVLTEQSHMILLASRDKLKSDNNIKNEKSELENTSWNVYGNEKTARQIITKENRILTDLGKENQDFHILDAESFDEPLHHSSSPSKGEAPDLWVQEVLSPSACKAGDLDKVANSLEIPVVWVPVIKEETDPDLVTMDETYRLVRDMEQRLESDIKNLEGELTADSEIPTTCSLVKAINPIPRKGPKGSGKQFTCPECSLTLSVRSLVSHLMIHARKKTQSDIRKRVKQETVQESLCETTMREDYTDDAPPEDLPDADDSEDEVLAVVAASELKSVKVFTCRVCAERFSNKTEYVTHKKTHKEKKEEVKPMPDENDKSANDPRVRRHWERVLYTCEHCPRTFTQPSRLKRHRWNHVLKKPFPCDVCDKSFSEKLRLENHKKTHTGERPHLCNECSKTFTQRCHLIRHIKVHRGIRAYLCQYCSRTYAQNYELTKHMLTHKEKDPSVKDENGKKSSDPSVAKPFACDVCFKAFKLKSVLNTHKKIHTGEKPFSCTVCFKKFSQKTTMMNHMRTHTLEKPFICGKCHTGFGSQSNLLRHNKINCNILPGQNEQLA